jgi:hypothetical protein
MLKSLLHGISALMGPISALKAFSSRADMGPLGLICHAIWILSCIISYIYVMYNLDNVDRSINRMMIFFLSNPCSIMYPLSIYQLYAWMMNICSDTRNTINSKLVIIYVLFIINFAIYTTLIMLIQDLDEMSDMDAWYIVLLTLTHTS